MISLTSLPPPHTHTHKLQAELWDARSKRLLFLCPHPHTVDLKSPGSRAVLLDAHKSRLQRSWGLGSEVQKDEVAKVLRTGLQRCWVATG